MLSLLRVAVVTVSLCSNRTLTKTVTYTKGYIVTSALVTDQRADQSSPAEHKHMGCFQITSSIPTMTEGGDIL